MKTAQKTAMKIWAAVVKARDGCCQWCGRTDLNLEAHHLFPRSQGDWMVLYDPDYGAALCPACHGKATANPKTVRSEILKRIKLARYQYRSKFDELLKYEYPDMLTGLGRADKIEELQERARATQTTRPRWSFIVSILTIDLLDAQEWALDNQGCTRIFRPLTEAEN